MEHLFEEFGTGYLSILSGTVMVALLLSLLQENGILHRTVQAFIYSICG